MTWVDKGSQMYMDLSALLTQSSSWNELYWEFFLGNKLVQSGALGELTIWECSGFFLLDEFSVYRIKLFLLFFIAFRQRSCPCPWSFLGRRLAVLKKITRIAEGCPHNKEKYWRGQGRADNDTGVLLFHWLHKFLPVLEFCRCGRWKGRFANWEWFLSHCVLVIYLHFLLVILLGGAIWWYIYL